MTTEIKQINENGEVTLETVSVDVPASDELLESNDPLASDFVIIQDSSTTETAEEAWRSFQTKTTAFFADTAESLSEFFKNNKPLLINVGWVLLALLGVQLLFTILDVVDSIPLISPILKLVGLVYASWFVWRYLLRASSRQELSQIIDRTRSEVLGDRS